jgi:hypothetical protein
MSSALMSPVTNDSTESQSRQASSPPSSPPADSPAVADKKIDQPHEAGERRNVADDEEDDDEEMGTKAKALTNLLKTSSVCLQHFIHQLQ